MEKIKWYYPESIEEAVGLLDDVGNIPHSGGTGIMMRGLKNIKGLVDLSRLDFETFDVTESEITLGAMLSYAAAAEHMNKFDKEAILSKALVMSVPPALRNRITLGGSIGFSPIWSDLIGPLVALRAKVKVIGKNEGIYSIEEFVKSNELKKQSFVSHIIFAAEKFNSYYYRATRVNFDYSAFNISILSKGSSTIEDIRIVIHGNTTKFAELCELEKMVIGKSVSEINLDELISKVDIEFADKMMASSAYLKHLALVELKRGLEQILRG